MVINSAICHFGRPVIIGKSTRSAEVRLTVGNVKLSTLFVRIIRGRSLNGLLFRTHRFSSVFFVVELLSCQLTSTCSRIVMYTVSNSVHNTMLAVAYNEYGNTYGDTVGGYNYNS
jgi:hypothetical protein